MIRAKKYFSISEVSEIIGLPEHKLRYIEKTNNKIKITKIRGRRYYKTSDIQLIQKEYCGIVIALPPGSDIKISDSVLVQEGQKPKDILFTNNNLIADIDTLIAKLQNLLI